MVFLERGERGERGVKSRIKRKEILEPPELASAVWVVKEKDGHLFIF
jgi:hypothetical protein